MISYYNNFTVSKDAIHIIGIGFGTQGSYGSIVQYICIGHYSYTGYMRGTICHVTPIQGPVLKKIKFSLQKKPIPCYSKIIVRSNY